MKDKDISRKKIMFVIPTMKGGGSERVISIVLKHLDRKKFDIILVLMMKKGGYLKDLPNDIKIIDLNVNRARWSFFKISYLIQNIKPDMVLSTLGYLNLVLSILRPFFSNKIKFIARESNTVSESNKYVNFPRFFNWLYRTFYNNFDIIISQSNYMKQDLVENYGIIKEKIFVINNPVDFDKIHRLMNENKISLYDSEKINLLAVGRLDLQKGFDLLLHALAKLDSKYFLTVLGDGVEKENLLKKVKELKIDKQINIIGFQENPYQYMNQADIVILSSRYEGFPNVVLEANYCGTPVVGFDCPGGTHEIIKNGINGFLVECGNIDKLTHAINQAIVYEWDSQEITRIIKDKYSVNQIINKYEKVIL